MTDPITTAFEIGVTVGGLSCFSIIVAALNFNARRSKSIRQALFTTYLDMIENEKRTIKITVEKAKRKLKLVSFSVVSDLY